MASSVSEAQAELIGSLSPDDIPIKLRCAICSKLAVNAFRLPCCEQAICESCQFGLPQSCPVCEHSPLAAEDCNPNKSLRTTIRVFLRTAEKKREANRPKESKDSTPATCVEAPKPSLPSGEPLAQDAAVKDGANGTAPTEEAAAPRFSAQIVGQSASKAPATQPKDGVLSGPTSEKGHEAGDAIGPQQGEHDGLLGNVAEGGGEDQNTGEVQGLEQSVAEKPQGPEGEGNGPNSYGMNGGYPGMMFPVPGDLNQMQMMMAMQNGMGSNSFGGYSMMGMGMDPMTMQNMYLNGGFQGMGMNDMNGMGDYGVGFGQGSNNNWNGAQSWNFDQNNYNQSGLGMGAGDFGNFNAGFQTGYNQGNYGHFNDYRGNNFFGRARGRGRGYHGGYGRGGYRQHGGMSNNQDQGHLGQPGPGNYAQGQVDSGGRGDSGDGRQVSERGRSLPGRTGDEGSQGKGRNPGGGDNADAAHGASGELASREAPGNEATGDVSRIVGSAPTEPGTIESVLSTPDVPINAPTGPKAMRQGLPNTSLHHLRARGYQVDGVPSLAGPVAAQQRAAPGDGSRPRSRSLDRENNKVDDSVRDRSKERPVDQEKHGTGSHSARDQSRDRSRPRSRKGNKDEGQSQSRSHSRSRSRSRSHGHGSSQRQRRQRSQSAEDDDERDGGPRHKKQRSSRKQHGDDEDHGSKEEKKPRPVSPDESRRSSHRDHKDKDHDSRRDRDKYRDDDRLKSGHRSRRERERDRDREYEYSRRRDKDRDRDRNRNRRERRERRRARDRERGRKPGSRSRRPSADDKPAAADKGFDPPSGPRGLDFGGSSRSDRDQHGSHGSASKASTPKDPHTMEREARNRERLLKEAQRMAGLATLAGSKRGRDEDDVGGHKSRRNSRRSEARDGDEERMRRLEAEREGGRWG